MTSALELLVDVYGTYGRPGALADWLELSAIAGRRHTESGLADLIDDNGWTRRPARHFHVDAADYDLEASPEELAAAAFLMLTQRASSLGPHYPFDFHRGALRYPGGNYTPYMSLLAISVAHAWPQFTFTGAESPENILEHVVAVVLQDRGLSVAAMGALDRGSSDFASNLKAGCDSVGLRAMPKPFPIAISAKDAGVDTLAAITWRDGRQGQWVIIGQVTCAQTDEWESKLDRPKPRTWADYLLEPHSPRVFLAVPHHADRRHLASLLKPDRGIVLDRLRLASHSLGVSAEERKIIDNVLAHEVSDGRASTVTAA